ncbi:lipid A 3-O-deacylase PagL [Aquimarina sp. MAR_2010_214]|uniref:acyloxyacyl hydrolase n=1 Tax=Aquimarina sp. MAR_2010_214 TaxID=1250026 RepID=UPI000C7027E5|nr:acyloxyacyl hydrolase [Aquimarina sp. MAR_2010_214]PKV52326.1 lipid A 3-O-deacylase PagL [Aquimarina sp. MAR_2010_214]
MRKIEYYLFLFFIGIQLRGQTSSNENKNSFFISPEIIIGKTTEPNTGFPETKMLKSIFVSIGSYNKKVDTQWSSRLGYPKTGLAFGVTDFGNIEKVGKAYVVMPFVEIGLFQKKSNRWHLNMGFGASYLDTKYDSETNPLNKAVTTSLNWSYKTFLYYDVLVNKSAQWRLGLGYGHYSNGHTKLPNQGLNSFLISASSSFGEPQTILEDDIISLRKERVKSSQNYFSFRSGIGQNVLSEVFNDKKEVYSVALSMGKVVNRIFKFGIGFYGRFYEHYYDYIKNDEMLIQQQVPFFKEKPVAYASNYGFFTSTEVFIGHIGVEFELGLNVYKPFYKIEWQLSQGETRGDEYVLGELNWYYEIKRAISSRLGVKYYLFNMHALPKNNIFLGANINANLGQADFSELSLGYVYRFNLKERKKEYSN